MNTIISLKGLRYKLNRTTLLRKMLLTFIFCFALGTPLVLLWVETIAFFQVKDLNPSIFSLARLMLLVVLLMSFTFLFVTVTAILELFAYIRVTPDGIEQRRSPLSHVKYTWSDMEKIGKSQLRNDIIFIKSSSRPRASAGLSTSLIFLQPRQPFILLTGFEGWPEGGLKDNLKNYAPELFQPSSDHKSA